MQVSQIDMCRITEALVRIALKREYNIAHGPDHPTKQQQFAFELMDLTQNIRRRMLKDKGLQFFGAIAVMFEYRKAAVDDHIQQGIGQKADVIAAQTGA